MRTKGNPKPILELQLMHEAPNPTPYSFYPYFNTSEFDDQVIALKCMGSIFEYNIMH
jgi:hypothetical protein